MAEPGGPARSLPSVRLREKCGQKGGWFSTHKHRLGGEILCFHVRIPVEPHLLGLDEPLEGREQLCYPKGDTKVRTRRRLPGSARGARPGGGAGGRSAVLT